MTAPPIDLAQVFHRRVTTCRAVQVTASNLSEVAAWCGGSTWAASVLVPMTSNGQRCGEVGAPVGAWVLQVGTCYEAWTDQQLRDQWVPVVGTEQEADRV
jgi:hypothetical protein